MKKLANKISLLVIILTLQACGSGGTDQKDKNSEQNSATLSLSNEQVKNAGVVVNKGEVKKISSIIKVNGKIEVPPQNMVSVSVMLGGYLKSTHLLPGTKIKQGEVIAIFEDQQYIQIQQDYLTSQEKMNYARKEYERQKDLNQSKASSDKVLQLAETEFKTQQITVRSLYEKLKLIGIRPESLNESNISRSINLYSPIDGFVSKVNVNIGKYVNPSDVIFELINPTNNLLTSFSKTFNAR
jgi:cobalt-zinc-cadmium efflux system membrane fusion protein